ncbi:MAG: tandem-95 repeat protein [Rhizobium sp.]|nr:tandem-95 repeat protein [Rhizobium sp.]
MAIVAGEEYRVNTHTANAQESAQVAVLPNGGWVVTWRSYSQDASNTSGVYQQVYAPNGTPVGGEVRVNTQVAGEQSLPRIVALGDGGWVVTWRSENQDGSSYGVYQKVYNANGSERIGEQLVNTHTTGSQHMPQIATLTDGGWVVTWQSDGQDGSGFGIYQQVYNADGSKQGTETLVNTFTGGNQTLTLSAATDADTIAANDYYHTLRPVVALPDGGWVVLWRSDSQDGDLGGTYVQAFNADGSKRGSETAVSSVAAGDQVRPRIAVLDDGGWVVTWMANQPGGNVNDIYQQAFNANGTKQGTEVRVNTQIVNRQENPQVTALDDGGWVVTWQSYTQDGADYGVYQQVYNENGSPRGTEHRVNTTTTNSQAIPHTTALNNGGWVVTWQSYTQDGSGGSVYMQAYKPDGTPDGGETQVNTYTLGDQHNPIITALPDGKWVITWWSVGQDGSAEGTYQRVFGTDAAPSNTPPTAGTPQAFTTNEDTKVSGTIVGQDLDGDGLVYTLVSGAGPTKGTLTLNPNGSFEYTPALNSNGSDSFTVSISDGKGGTTTKTINLTVTPVNDAPTAGTAQSFTALEDNKINGTVVGQDVDGDILTYAINTGPTKGALTLNANGSFEYTPTANSNGADSFVVTISDGKNGTTTKTINLTITPVNDAPTTGNVQSFTVVEDGSVNGTIVGQDVESSNLNYGIQSGPANGTLILNLNGNFTYTPAADYTGPDSFAVTITDPNGASVVKTITINVTPDSDGASISGDTGAALTETNAILTATGQLTITDPDAGEAAFQPATIDGTYGDLVIGADGKWTYTTSDALDSLAAGAVATDKVTVSSVDGTQQEITITITGTNDAAIIGGKTSAQLTETNAALSTSGALTISDIDSPATFQATSYAGKYGDLVLSAGGNWTYTMDGPHNEFAAGMTYADDIEVLATDGTTQVVSIAILGTAESTGPGPGPGPDPDPDPVNTAPVLSLANEDLSAESGAAILLTIGDGHFTDAEGTDLNYTITVNGGAAPAWMTFDTATGVFSGTPTTTDAGLYTIVVTASDGALSANDEFELTVTNPVAPPDPVGTKGKDKLVGNGFDNIMDGKRGNDKLTGEDGADTFVFGNKYGRDVIKDFDPLEVDIIDLSRAKGIDDFADLVENHLHDVGNNVKIKTDDGSVLIIRNFEAADLTEDMFLF